MKPLVTVVVPCFNQAQFLPATLTSIASQNYPALETIVVDDGSTDKTGEVAAAHGVRVLRQSNQGVSAARNAGLRAASGTFVVFLDADDELLPDAVRSGVDTLISNPEADLVVRRCQSVGPRGEPLPTHHPPVNPEDLYREWFGKNFVWAPGAAMFRCAAIAAIGGFPIDVGPAADYAMYLRFARVGRAVLVKEEVVRYRHHPASMSRDPIVMLHATLEVLARERKHVPRKYRREFRRGIREWRRYFGDRLVDGLRTDVRAHGFRLAHVRVLATLIRWCPSAAAVHAARKARLIVRARAPAHS